jgi:hypothetical protein
MIKLNVLLESVLEDDVSQASEKANQMGLDYMSFGRWGKDGKVTHQSQNGKLVPVDDKPTTSNTSKVSSSSSTGPTTSTSVQPKQKASPAPSSINTHTINNWSPPKDAPHLTNAWNSVKKAYDKTGNLDSVYSWVNKKISDIRDNPEFKRNDLARGLRAKQGKKLDPQTGQTRWNLSKDLQASKPYMKMQQDLDRLEWMKYTMDTFASDMQGHDR